MDQYPRKQFIPTGDVVAFDQYAYLMEEQVLINRYLTAKDGKWRSLRGEVNVLPVANAQVRWNRLFVNSIALAFMLKMQGEAVSGRGRLFVWTSDSRTRRGYQAEDAPNWLEREHWMGHLRKVLAEESIHDDCDGFAITAAQYLAHHGISREDIWLCAVLTPDGQEAGDGVVADHLICAYREFDGSIKLLDNRFHYPYPVDLSNYQFYAVLSLAAPYNQWQRVTVG